MKWWPCISGGLEEASFRLIFYLMEYLGSRALYCLNSLFQFCKKKKKKLSSSISSINQKPFWCYFIWENVSAKGWIGPEVAAGCLAEPDSAPPRVNGICLACHFIEVRGLRCREALTQTAHVRMEIVVALCSWSLQWQRSSSMKCWTVVQYRHELGS